MNTIRLTQKEVDRASNGLAIIARPQVKGVKVMAVRVNGLEGTALQGKPFSAVVEGKSGVSAAAKEIARWVDKMGFTCPMAAAARHR
jgi:hypothetical protein